MVRWHRSYKFDDTHKKDTLNPLTVIEYLLTRTNLGNRTLFSPYMNKHIERSYQHPFTEANSIKDIPKLIQDEQPTEKYAVLLSGGVDSTVLAKLYDNPDVLYIFVQTLCNENELQYFESVAKGLQGHTDVFRFTPELYHELQIELFERLPEPLGDPAIIAVYGAAKYIKYNYPDIKCIVVGEGGDEVFGGYWLYPEMAKTSDMAAVLDMAMHHWGVCFRSQLIDYVRSVSGPLVTTIEELHTQGYPLQVGVQRCDRDIIFPCGVAYKNTVACELNNLTCSIPLTHEKIISIVDTHMPHNLLVDPVHPWQTKIYLKQLALDLGAPRDAILRQKTGFSSIPNEKVLQWMQSDIRHLPLKCTGWLETSVLWSLWKWCDARGYGDQLLNILKTHINA